MAAMLSLGTASDAIVETIRQQAGAWVPDQLRALLDAGRKTRPADYDSVVKGLAVRYSGDQVAIVRDALKRSYPSTYQQLPIDPVNWLRFFARQDSGVYAVAADRTLVNDDDDAEALDEDDERLLSFRKALAQCAIDVVMPEMERRCHAGVRSAFALVGWRRIGAADAGKMVCQLYWPHDVVTLAHPSAPDDPDALWLCAIRQASSSEASPLWWVWSREFAEDDLGNLVSFGQWTHRRVSEDGKIATASEAYEGRFPGAFLRLEPGAGGIWPSPDRDVIVNVDRLNVSRSNRQHVVDMQAHATWVYSGLTRETQELIGGPGVVLQIGSGESLQAQTAGADHAAIEASATRDLQELGVSRGNSPDAYAVEPGAPQSGVSRMIANAPHDQRVAESRPIFKAFEEGQLLPIVLDVLQLFDPSSPSDFGGVKPQVTLATAKTYEADNEKQDRVLALKDAGLIDDVDARVMLGLSADRASAEAYLDQLAEAKAPQVSLPGALAGSPFTSRRETTVEPDGEDEGEET
jgi:hypothetical protein